MKKITLLLILFITSLGFSQQQQYLFDFEPGGNDSNAAIWNTFDNSPPPAEVVLNPDLDGTNPTPSNVLKVVVGPENAFYAGVDNSFSAALLGTWELDLSVSSNLTVSMDINKNYVGTVGIKMGTTTGGTTFQITDQNVGNTIVDEWQTLTWDLSGINPNGDLTNISQFVVFVDWTQGLPDRAPGSTIHIDNITFGANKLTDEPAPSCTDGIQNGTETGVDCGGTDCAPCAVTPTTDSPEQGSTGSDLYVYSDLGDASNTVTNFQFNQFSGSVAVSESDIEGNGNNAGLLQASPAAFWFYGAGWDAVDLVAGGYNFVHLNYYSTSSTEFNFFLIDQTAGIGGGAPEEPRFRFGGPTPDAPIVPNTWQSVFIPLQHFLDYVGPGGQQSSNYDLNDIGQYKFDGNGSIYFDNIYFSTTNTLGVNDFDQNNFATYPNPTNDSWTIVSNNANIQTVEIFNTLGRLVKTVDANGSEVRVDASELSSGIYFAKVNSQGNAAQTIKLIRK